MSIGINIPEYRVSQFNLLFKEMVERNFDYVRIRGEISELKKASSGHLYLTLKDDNSILNATIWNQKIAFLQITPEVGMEVIVTGKISTYAKSISTYSINIDKLELAGEGALLKLIEDRKKKLKEKGFFEEKFKKRIPYLPDKIGVITSPTGSVIHDIINRIKERFPVDIDIWPVSVQGVNSAEDVIAAIKGFNSENYLNKPDILIIARGGGSIEDLMTFNDEQLAIAVYNSWIPIISAIGHETDTTIIDFVSDLRTSTPTAAAEKAVPLKSEVEKSLMNLISRYSNLIENKLNNFDIQLTNLSKFLKAPKFIIESYNEKIFKVNSRLIIKIKDIYQNNFNQLNQLGKSLRSPEESLLHNHNNLKILLKNLNKIINDNYISQHKELTKLDRLMYANSIKSNLEKGYSIVRKSNKIIKESDNVKNDDKINIQFSDQSINFKIKKI